MDVLMMRPTNQTSYEVITVTDIVPNQPKCEPCFYCQICMDHMYYFEKNNQKYCWKCFEKLFGLKCIFCKKTIYGFNTINFVYFNNKSWHPDCFKCEICKKDLKENWVFRKSHLSCKSCGTLVKL